jgi:hypothetical protein
LRRPRLARARPRHCSADRAAFDLIGDAVARPIPEHRCELPGDRSRRPRRCSCQASVGIIRCTHRPRKERSPQP